MTPISLNQKTIITEKYSQNTYFAPIFQTQLRHIYTGTKPKFSQFFSIHQKCPLKHREMIKIERVLKFSEADLGLLQHPRWSAL